MPRAGLTGPKVIAEAGDLADEVGLERLSIAAVARRLAVADASLYSHVGGLGDLRARVAEQARSELAEHLGAAVEGRSGRDALDGYARAYRRYATHHPGRMAAVEEPPAPTTDDGGDGARIVRASYAVFRDYGLVEPDLTDAVRFVRSTLHGFTDLERRARSLDPAPVDATFTRVVDALDAALTHWPDRRVVRPTRHRLEVDGASLPYEVRGTGPLLVLLGAPVVRAFWEPVADALAGDHTVVTYDPRGFGAASGAAGDLSPARLAADVVALVERLDVGPARLVGCSGGAVTGVEVALRRPDLVAGLVAHEPPLVTLLPDRGELGPRVHRVRDALRVAGPVAAQELLAALVTGQPEPLERSPAPDAAAPPTGETDRDVVAFLGDLLVPTLLHDLEPAVVAGMIVGVGATSTGELPRRCATALSERTGSPLASFPGGHLGAAEHPHAFADRIREVLAWLR